MTQKSRCLQSLNGLDKDLIDKTSKLQIWFNRILLMIIVPTVLKVRMYVMSGLGWATGWKQTIAMIHQFFWPKCYKKLIRKHRNFNVVSTAITNAPQILPNLVRMWCSEKKKMRSF